MSVSEIGHIIGWLAVVLVGALFVFNGVVMLFSPGTWFRLPAWLAGRGTMTKQKYDSRNGHLQVRVLGAIFIALVVYVLIDLLHS